MEKTIALLLFENGTFYLISRDHNQPIKRPEFNEIYNPDYTIYNTFFYSPTFFITDYTIYNIFFYSPTFYITDYTIYNIFLYFKFLSHLEFQL